jgi:hypothetical protein
MRFWAQDAYGRPHKLAAKSGASTALGIITIVLGSVLALVGSWLLLRGVLFDGRPHLADRRMGGVPTVIMATAGVSVLFLGVSFILAGVGVVKRRPWKPHPNAAGGELRFGSSLYLLRIIRLEMISQKRAVTKNPLGVNQTKGPRGWLPHRTRRPAATFF